MDENLDNQIATNSEDNAENVENKEEQKGLDTELDNEQDSGNDDSQGNQNKEKVDSEIYGSPESFDYSEIKLPEGMTLDNEMLEKFNPLAKKYNLSNKSANELLNLAVEMQSKNMAKIGDIANELQENEKNSYLQLLNTDKELSSMSEQEYSQYLSTANLGLKSFATDGFKELLKAKGLVNHPEIIKSFHAVGKFCKTDSLPNPQKPVGKKEDIADILYGTNESDS